ncbi:MAG: DNA methyltransferase [Methylomicrobium sp.]
MLFRDVLYGEISLPEWIIPFLRLPEFVRLRGVRLSNIDSIQFKDFGSATRYDHAIGVVHLALKVASLKKLSQSETIHLAIAALLHDAGTPPFAHTLEIVFDDVDHELELWSALGLEPRGHDNGFNAYNGELPQFVKKCESVSKSLKLTIRPETIGQIISGQGELGFLIKGTIDLDNIDNVIRGTHYMGFPEATGSLALAITEWLSTLDKQPSLKENIPQAVQSWKKLRDEYYRLFYDSIDEEKGRQALLQFIIRESNRLGFPKESILKTTDEGLLYSLTEFAKNKGTDAQYLSDAVRKFRHLDPIHKVTELPIDDEHILNALRVKSSIDWMEIDLRQPGFIPMIFFAKRRFSKSLMPKDSLFPYSSGFLSIFALYEPKHDRHKKSDATKVFNVGFLQKKLSEYSFVKPWSQINDTYKPHLQESLNAWGDWSFIGSKNEPLHSYPSTFVHAIPAALIKSLRLSGELLMDPFCGSGVTGIEAAKAGCRVICSDINEIALLISRVRSTYLSNETRNRLRRLNVESFNITPLVEIPKMENIQKWHHAVTIEQLANILTVIEGTEVTEEREFLKLCFSAILTSTTARRGKEHGWFADNTPLPKGESAPPYIDAYGLFLNRIARNLRALENIYADFERRGENPFDELQKMRVLRANAGNSSPGTFDIEQNTVGGIITSPPYLCMSDYSLGQRLSYAWLFPNYMDRDFNDEIGARRRRSNPTKAMFEYIENMKKFAQFCQVSVRPGGFVALVLGAPVSTSFKDKNILGLIDSIMLEHGFSLLWEKWRPINWHRNHGYERLKTEKLTVFVRE